MRKQCVLDSFFSAHALEPGNEAKSHFDRRWPYTNFCWDFHNWLKQHHLYIGICPSMSDYYDKCKEFEEETTGCQQIINRLVQSGHATFSSMKKRCCSLCNGKGDVQPGKKNVIFLRSIV